MRPLFALVLVILALILLSLLLWAGLTWAATTRCLTYEEKTLGRLQTLCDDGSRATSYGNRTMERWETPITASLKTACTGPMHPRTRPVEVPCR